MQFCLTDETYSNIRIPGLVMTEKGTLIGACECRRTISDWAQIDILLRRSRDGGETWQDALRIPGEGETLNNPVLTVQGSRIWLHYCENYRRLFVRESRDDGLTFSEPREITEIFSGAGFFYNVFAVGPGHGIAIGSKMILPVWIAQNREQPQAHRPSFIATVYSPDDGRSWCLGESLDCSGLANPSECALAPWAGGVISSIRNENGDRRRAFAHSPTGYDGWSKPALAENMPDPICQGSMVSDGGELWHLNCAATEGRINLTLKHSCDGFKTWDARVIDPVGGYGDLAVDRKYIYILYEREFGRDGLFFVKIKR